MEERQELVVYVVVIAHHLPYEPAQVGAVYIEEADAHEERDRLNKANKYTKSYVVRRVVG
jgi:hypothetical protein